MRRYLLLLPAIIFSGCSEDDRTVPFEPDPDAVYFEVAEISKVHGDSYLLPLKEAADIAMAREIISSKESKIIIAEISKVTKAEHYNVDLERNKKWKWYISDFLEFSDFSIEILDGWPQYVEDNYDDWVNNTKGDNGRGRIGFWSYTIKREVTHEELRATR